MPYFGMVFFIVHSPVEGLSQVFALMAYHNPKVIVLISGKRKSGKDFLAEHLRRVLIRAKGEDVCVIQRISGPLKKEFALLHSLSFDRLSDNSSYKEEFRKEMVRWSDEIRQRDPFHFCRLAVLEAGNAAVWIVSDIRRHADIRYFGETFGEKLSVPILKVRLEASLMTRSRRGWNFEAGIDDAETECALDDEGIPWDFTLINEDPSLITDGENPFISSFNELVNRIRAFVE